MHLVNQAMQWRVLMEIRVLGAMEVNRECRAGTKIHKWAGILEAGLHSIYGPQGEVRYVLYSLWALTSFIFT